MLAIFVSGSQFYTSFALGSWLCLDFFDYKLNKTSILSYFYSHKHRHAFYIFFFTSFVFCFVIDYLWGVRIFKMWQWKNYGIIEFARMYFVMNASFVLGMYELYRVLKTLLKRRFKERNILHFRISTEKKKAFYLFMLFLGTVFFIFPIFMIYFNNYSFKEYIMLFLFMSMILVSDAITFLTGGKPILGNVFRLDLLKIASFALTVSIAVVFTEGLNLFGREWVYLQMPFYNLQIFTVPVAVAIGWIPLVIGAISIINMIKHLDYAYKLR